MRTLEFRIDCDPPKSTHQAGLRIINRKSGKPFIGKYPTGKAVKLMKELTALFAPHAPSEPLEGPLSLKVIWVYPYRKAEPQKNRTGLIRCDKRPDCSNLIKMPEDIMCKLGFFNDDSQIYDLRFKKYWGSYPGIEVTLMEIEQWEK